MQSCFSYLTVELRVSMNQALVPSSIISIIMANLNGTDFFDKVISLYKQKNNKALVEELELLFAPAGQPQKGSWGNNFNFAPFAKMDNMAGVFLNILEAIQIWQKDKSAGSIGSAFDFDSYTLVLETCLVYLDQMSRCNQWFSPCVKYLVLKSKSVIREAKYSGMDSIETTKSLEKLIQQLRYYKSSKSIDSQTKRDFQLMINNLLVSCYLSLRDYTKSKKILDDQKIVKDLQLFSRPQINNYHFQTARLCISENNIDKARSSLEAIAFTTSRQRRLVLKYLIPCNMYAWKFPVSPSFPEYDVLAKSIVSGNFREFFQVVEKYKMVWIKRGIYSLIVSLLTMVWRNFMRRLHKYSETETMSLKQITIATHLMNGNFSQDDCLFYITNLICQGLLRAAFFLGSHDQKTLVFKTKKGDLFPKIKLQ